MKEGSFTSQISDLDFENDIKSIRTPDQMPERIDLTRVPENVLRSGVIESLIQQNDDLMSRLTVNLRRVANLEEKLTDSLNESAQYRAKYDNIKDQVLILREQSRILSERIRNADSKNNKDHQSQNELKEQIQVLEIRYAELLNSNQVKISKLEKKLSTTQRLVSAFQKYRGHIRKIYANLHTELKALREKNFTQQQAINDLRQNLSETTTYITTQAKEHKSQCANLTAAYEAQLKSQTAEIEMLVEQNKVLGERSTDFERIYTEKVKLENDLVIAERREADLRIQTDAEVADMQKSLARYRNDAKALTIEIENATKENQTLTATCHELKTQNSAMSEQVDTLQLLWRDQQTQIEKYNEQKNSLQKLNQELSITINEYRREIRELKEKIDTLEQKNFEFSKIEKAKAQVKANITENTNVIKREDTVTPEIISKIDKVLNNLHVGR